MLHQSLAMGLPAHHLNSGGVAFVLSETGRKAIKALDGHVP